jgi:hypothetical protein
MRRFAQAFFGLAIDIVGVILAIMVGGVGAAIGFVIGFIIFGVILGLKGWVLAIPAHIVAGLGFVIGALLFWGLTATVDDIGDAIGRKLRDDDRGGEDR